MGKHLEQALPSVYTLQCLTRKVDNNNNNTPIVLAATGGLAHEATVFISDLLLFWPKSGEMIILWFWVGCVVA